MRFQESCNYLFKSRYPESINLRISNAKIQEMAHYYIKKIKRLSEIPSRCMNCNGINLVIDAIFTSTGPTQENTNYRPSVLCLTCEMLMIITHESDVGLGLQASTGNEMTIRN